ncbi:MAG: argininosuccinate lyase [Chloroflexi bacterium]|nr:argininosuccinate lyase [Chloroflexota bacterium]
MTLWGGRFKEGTAAKLRQFKDSIGFDQRMYAEDIAGSIVYARALARAKVLQAEEAETIIRGLEAVRKEFAAQQFEFRETDEDIHTAVERRLIEIVGAVGGKLHAGRSRNEQVATDLRLWLLHRLPKLDEALKQLQVALIQRASEHTETAMPGYTHLQPAQPISVAHWFLSYCWMLMRDRGRLRDARRRMALCPLGSGAIAGTPFPLDREAMARELGFTAPTQNSLDAVSDRDFVAETAFALALIGTHLSRFAEDIVIFSNPGFGFIRLPDRYSTGSSLMPQKRNADVFELTRGKAGRLLGNLVALMSMMKALPSGYNADLQEDKEAIFDSMDALAAMIPLLADVVVALEIDEKALRAALDEELLATDLSEYLVRKGVPFRTAHEWVGKLVAMAEETGTSLSALPLDRMQAVSQRFEKDVYRVFDMDHSLASRDILGGTAPQSVRGQLEMARDSLERLDELGGMG